MRNLSAPLLMAQDTDSAQIQGRGYGIEVCPACQSAGYKRWGEKHGFELWRCLRCEVIFTCLRDGASSLDGFYDRYYDYSRFEVPPIVTASLERVVRVGEKFRRSGRWLDSGFGEGAILRIAEGYGWKCYGTDIAPQALHYGEQRGWVVSADAENDARFPAQGFAVVTMIEFIEHVPNPERFLRSAAGWLRPGGALYLTTPNAASINSRLLGMAWSIFSPPEHITIWTARGICQALKRAGFQPQHIRTEGFNPSEILSRWWPGRFGTETPSRNQTGLAINNAFSSSRPRRAAKAAINQFLSALRIGDGLKVWAVASPQGDLTQWAIAAKNEQ